ncbi:MAG: pyridoxamine 5'-phosphate oxidase [Euryarchaeota archaeon]|nr:pyridoxamine 5'-phosphate oxidase [Euryarchaeota archaeon]
MKSSGKDSRDGGVISIDDKNKPLELLFQWIQEAKDNGIIEPNAMSLATVNEYGSPRNRMVLAKYLDGEEVGFFTNLDSDKSLEIITNENVSCTFWWPEIGRQVRLEGRAVQMDRKQVLEYHSTRPRKSRIAAWASDQSRVLESMDHLQKIFFFYESKFGSDDIPVPPHWGGYVIRINRVEYWSGRPNRLHERIVLSRLDNSWTKHRLNP